MSKLLPPPVTEGLTRAGRNIRAESPRLRASTTTCSATHFDWLYPKSSSSIFSFRSVSFRTDLTAQPNTKVGSRDIIELFGSSLERQSYDLIRSQHVRVTHQVVVEQVVHGCTVVEHRVDFTREEIPQLLRQAQLWLP